MRLLYLGSGWLPVVDAIRRHLPPGATIAAWDRATPLLEAVRQAEVLLPSNAGLSAEAIAAAPGLRLVQQPAVGVDGIDLAAARARGIPVCNSPGANGRSVAEAALLLILLLARRYPAARRAFAEARIGVPLGRELHGKRLGVIGRGRSGAALLEAAAGLGMEGRAVTSADGRAGLLELLGWAEVVSVHCPLTPATRGLLDAAAFAALRPGALLVNCARGPIVDRGALERALDSGRLAGAGLDVFWQEPWDPADPLFAREEVVTLPHVGGSTEEAFDRLARVVAGNVERVMRGEEPLHRVG